MDADAEDGLYEIRIRGVLSDRLLRAFPDLEAKTRDGQTVLVGALPDQASLFGVLAQIEALGLTLLEVRYEPPHPERSEPGRMTHRQDPILRKGTDNDQQGNPHRTEPAGRIRAADGGELG